MRRWKLVTLLVLGVLWMLACEEQARKAADEAAVDSPLAGVWYLQAVSSDRPIAGDVDVFFEFKALGAAAYERRTNGPEQPIRFDLRYNLSGDLISIDSNDDDPNVPRITGKIELSDDKQTLHIQTHSDERWVLTREARPGGDLESVRAVAQLQSKADPMLVRVQHVAYAVSRYEQLFGERAASLVDLLDAGLIEPAWVTLSGLADDVPARYPRMTEQQRSGWVNGNAAFALIDADPDQRERATVVVATLPRSHGERVIVGMSNGSVHFKSAVRAAEQVQRQGGALPERWPGAALNADAAAGLEPLGD